MSRSAESRKRTSDAIKKWHREMSEEKKKKRIENLSKANKQAYIDNPELRKINSRNTTKRFQDPEYRKAHSEKIKAYFQTPKGKAQIERSRKITSKTHKGKKRTKQHRERMSAGISNAILQGKMHGYYKRSKRGHYQSSKVGRIYYRSAYELKAFMVLDEDDNVNTYKHDVIRVPYHYNGINRYYIIDLDIRYKDGTRKLVEIKPTDFLNDKEVVKKIAAAKEVYGNQFEVWTEKELGCEDYHKLLEELKDYV